MKSFDDLWARVAANLCNKYGETISDLWFTSLTLYDLSDDLAIVICDMPYKYKILKSKYLEPINDAINEVLGFNVKLIIVDKTSDYEEYITYVKEDKEIEEPQNLADKVVSIPRMAAAPFDPEIYENIPEDVDEEMRQKIIRQRVASAIGGYNEYTFDNFIVGQSNKFAHAAALAVAKEPACLSDGEAFTYNPLFIYGPSGLGKTHLLYAIVNELKSRYSTPLKIVYVKGDEFTNQLIDSISKKTPEQFREKYRKTDVLLIDDIQFIAGRETTQEEFFHTFNALYEDHKQIILTSDRPPRDIKTLEDRLKTRFEWGITADIQPPDPDLRAAIIKKKAEDINITLNNDVINFLAENLKSNIRQVEGAIKKLGALSMLTGEPITEELAKNALSDLMTSDEPTSVTIERILDKVSKKYGITKEDIRGSKRTKEIALARHVSVYLIRKFTNLSLLQIAKTLGRDHTTIMSSIKRVETALGSPTQIDGDIKELMKEIQT